MVVGQLAVQRRRGGHAVVVDQEGVAIGRRLGDMLGANDTATATVSAVAAVNEAAYGTTGATVNVNVASYVTINDVDTNDVRTPVVTDSLAVSAVVIKNAAGAVVPTPVGVTGNLSSLFTTSSNGQITYDREDFSFLKTGQYVEAVFNFSAQSGSDVMAKSLTVQINGATETYTAKAMAALIADARDGLLQDEHVLFWNTYNSCAYPELPVDDSWRKLPLGFHPAFRVNTTSS